MSRYRGASPDSFLYSAFSLLLGSIAMVLGVILIPALVSILICLGRAYQGIIAMFLGILDGVTGWDTSASDSARMGAGMAIGAGTLTASYFAILVGTHIGGFLAVGAVGLFMGFMLALLGILRPHDSGSFLEGLRFWEGR